MYNRGHATQNPILANGMDNNRRLYFGSLILVGIIGTAVAWGESIGLALFVSELGVKALPLAIIGEALLSLIFIFSFEQFKGLIHDAAMIVVVCMLGVVVLIVGHEFIRNDSDLGFGIYYAAQRIMRDLLLFYVGSYLSSYYESHTRYLLLRLLVASRLIVAAAGFSLAFLTLFLSALQLVWWWGGALVLSALAVALFADEFHGTPRSTDTAAARSKRPAKISSIVRGFFGSRLMRYLSLGAFSMMFIFSITYFQAVDVFFARFSEETSLLRWLAVMSGFTGLAMVIVQYQLLPRVLHQTNVDEITTIYPVTAGIASISVLAVPQLAVAAGANIASDSLQESLYEPLHNQIKNTLPASIRQWSHSLLDGVLEPLGRLMAGIVLVIVIIESIPAIFLIVAVGVMAAALAYSQFRAGQEFAVALDKSLEAGQYGFLRQSAQDQLAASQEVVDALLERLNSLHMDDRAILLIAEALAETGSPEGFENLMAIWPLCAPSVQAELLLLLATGWPKQRGGDAIQVVIAEALESDEPKLRRAALQAMTLYPDLIDTFRTAQYLIDPEPDVSTTAAKLLLQHPSAHLARAAEAQLNWLSRASSSATRAQAVSALVTGSVNRFGERTLELDFPRFLGDRSPRVRMNIIPAADVVALIPAAYDVSPAVRQLAFKHLGRSRRLAARHILTALSEQRATSPDNFQINDVMRHWHLLTALGAINPAQGREQARRELDRGFLQYDFLSSMQKTLQTMKYPPLKPIVAQLIQDRAELIEAIFDFLAAIYDSDEIQSLKRTLEIEPSEGACVVARERLAKLTTGDYADYISQILRNPRDNAILVTSNKLWQPDNPRDVATMLLTQDDHWLPLLSLYALSALPQAVFEALVDRELINDLLENGRRSSQDAVREGTRVLREALKEEFAELRGDSELSRIAPRRQEEGVKMLSTIERMLFLRNVRFFENLRLDQLRTLAQICEELSVSEGEYILRKGEAGDKLFIIVEGDIHIIDPDIPKENSLLSVRGPGDVIGEISLFDGGLRTADGLVMTPALLLLVPRDALDTALADDPGIAMVMLGAMAEHVRETNKSITQLSVRLNLQDVVDEL